MRSFFNDIYVWDEAHMRKFILGKKIGMSNVFDESGRIQAVTFVDAGPCTIVSLRTPARDGYAAVQVGYGSAKKANKAQIGAWKDLGKFRKIREFRVNESELPNFQPGGKIGAAVFQIGDKIEVSGTSKSKGFQGVMKRHGFKGAPATHGTKHAHRQPGSIGTRFPQHVTKGRRMAGRMGGDRVTVKGLEIFNVDEGKSIIVVKGAVPGRRGSVLEIKGK